VQAGFVPKRAPLGGLGGIPKSLEEKIDVLMGIYKPKSELTPGLTPKYVETVFSKLAEYYEKKEGTREQETMRQFVVMAKEVLKKAIELPTEEQKRIMKALQKTMMTEEKKARTMIKDLLSVAGRLEAFVAMGLVKSKEFMKKYGKGTEVGISEHALGTRVRSDILAKIQEEEEFGGKMIHKWVHAELGLKEYGKIKEDVYHLIEQYQKAREVVSGVVSEKKRKEYIKSLKSSLKAAESGVGRDLMATFLKELIHVVETAGKDPGLKDKAIEMIDDFLFSRLKILSAYYTPKQIKEKVVDSPIIRQYAKKIGVEKVSEKEFIKAFAEQLGIEMNLEEIGNSIKEMKEFLSETLDGIKEAMTSKSNDDVGLTDL